MAIEKIEPVDDTETMSLMKMGIKLFKLKKPKKLIATSMAQVYTQHILADI